MELLSVDDIARLAHVTKRRAYLMIGRRWIPAVRIGGRVHVPVAAWNAWVDEMTARALAGAKIPALGEKWDVE